LELPAPAGGFVVEGKVRLQQIGQIDKYSPLTRLAIASAPAAPGKSPDEVAGFVLTAVPASAVKKGAGKGLIQFLQWDERRGGTQQPNDAFDLATAPQELSFRIVYDGHTATMRIGDQEKSLPLVAKQPVVRIICSTGEFLYTDLKISPQG
jgi:hypothetical protein